MKKFATVVSLASLIAVAGLAGCRSTTHAAATPSPQAAAAQTTLPATAKELEPLAFMSGRWVFPTPNGRLVNREHWMSPAGKSMVGAFQQLRRDGSVAFYEFTAIVAESEAKDGPIAITLYHRHLHPKLAIDDKRKNADVFKLKSTGTNSATFVPAVDIAGGIESMTYRLDGPDKLVQEIAFKPDSKEKTFSTTYTREQ